MTPATSECSGLIETTTLVCAAADPAAPRAARAPARIAINQLLVCMQNPSAHDCLSLRGLPRFGRHKTGPIDQIVMLYYIANKAVLAERRGSIAALPIC